MGSSPVPGTQDYHGQSATSAYSRKVLRRPPTDRSSSPKGQAGTSGDADGALFTSVGTSVECQAVVTVHPELARVIAAWPTLPEVIKAGILAMVNASSGKASPE